MDRRAFVATLAGSMLGVPPFAKAQQTAKLYTIGVLTSAAGPSPRYGPNLSGLAVLSDPDRPDRTSWDRAAGDAVQALRVEALMIPVHREGDLDAALTTVAAGRADALLATADPVVLLHLKHITDFAVKHRLPTAAYGRTIVDEGGLMSYGPNIDDLMRRTIFYADRILKGPKPADLPVEQPTKFELVINLKTARALGLTIPQSVLQRADQVIDP
jgi:putative ABC transport system substrate-binding protein